MGLIRIRSQRGVPIGTHLGFMLVRMGRGPRLETKVCKGFDYGEEAER